MNPPLKPWQKLPWLYMIRVGVLHAGASTGEELDRRVAEMRTLSDGRLVPLDKIEITLIPNEPPKRTKVP